MTANLDILSTDPSSKVQSIPFPETALDSSFTHPSSTPFPTLTVAPEYRHLRTETFLRWVNARLNVDPPITSLCQLVQSDALLSFVSILSNVDIPVSNEKPPVLRLLDMLCAWLDVSSLPLHIQDDALLHGDPEQLMTLLCFIATQYQSYTLYSLAKEPSAYINSHIHSHHTLPATSETSEQIILGWTRTILKDYVDASILPPVTDCADSWQDGLYFLALVHYHDPSLVVNFYDFLYSHDKHHRPQWNRTLTTAFDLAQTAFQIPILLDPHLLTERPSVDKECILIYLAEFIRAVSSLQLSDHVKKRRLKDIERLKQSQFSPRLENSSSTPSLCSAGSDTADEPFTTSTTRTSTYTVQQLRITKTTTMKFADGTDVPVELEEFETRAAAAMDKITAFQNRLDIIVPTRSSSYHPMPSSTTPEGHASPFSDLEMTSPTRSATESDEHHTRALHPLHAASEDLSTYDTNLKACQAAFQAFMDFDLAAFHHYASNELDTPWCDDERVLARKDQIQRSMDALRTKFDESEHHLELFRRGFSFAQYCTMIRNELDVIQTNMVKSITTDTDIQDLEHRIERTSGMIETIKTTFSDLLLSYADGDSQALIKSGALPKDDAYQTRFDAIVQKNELVRTWVEEVRIWFAEAERIRQWIGIRIEQLGETVLPDPLSGGELQILGNDIDVWNAKHAVLEKEIEAFDKEDMARLRAHVKALTGGGRPDKDLSPADTTTIEITLTTLTTLDKLMHSLRDKTYVLQVLTRRTAWEKEYQKAMAWLTDTDKELDEFLNGDARWQTVEEEASAAEIPKRERLMAKEKQKERIIQQLLALERKMTEFDQGQFTTTVNLFQDLDDTANIDLPDHLEGRQSHCEQLFEDLLKRRTFARQVVEQRLNVMDFLYQVDLVKTDAMQLQSDLQEAQHHVRPEDNDHEMTNRVQTMHEKIVQLLTAVASRIPYPSPQMEIDKESNDAANQDIHTFIDGQRTDLILLSERLEQQLEELRKALQLHRRAKQLKDDAMRLAEWADERVTHVRKARVDAGTDASTFNIDELQRLEQDRTNLLDKLGGGKEDEAVDLITNIHLLLESSRALENGDSIDCDSLKEASDYLSNVFDRLHQVLDDHGHDLQALRKKMEDDNTYFENAKTLRASVNEIRTSIPGLKQSCGFMTGQSEEQDRHRYEMLINALQRLDTTFESQQQQFNELYEHFHAMEPDKIENIEETREMQQQLHKDWSQLKEEMDDFHRFSDTVKQWYDRQRRLSRVENDLLAGLNDEIAALAQKGWNEEQLQSVEEKLQNVFNMLVETDAELRQADTKEDPLHTANYSCARDRHAGLMAKAQTVEANLQALKKDANKALAFSMYLGRAEALLAQVQEQKEASAQRLAHHGSTNFAVADPAQLETIQKNIQADITQGEAIKESLRHENKLLWEEAGKLQMQGYESRSVQEPAERVDENLAQLANAFMAEKRQAAFLRKLQIHAKAANDLSSWISQCRNAVLQLPTDVCIAEEADIRAELEGLEHKMAEIMPTIQAFQAMEARITSKEGQLIDLSSVGMEAKEIQLALKAKEDTVLQQWNDLRKQLDQAKLSLDQSRCGVEIARKVKGILTLVGDLKRRANNVEICSAMADEEAKIDVKIITSCPLAMMPTERESAAAKSALDILDHDIEQHLQVAIDDLDIMLKRNSDTAKIFEGQRAEITEAVRGLTDIMKAKRQAIGKAERMEGFLTVVEELEVLLSALSEVVDRASPEHARMSADLYSRADLQAMLIDLDTRYRYYEPKINELMDEAQGVAQNLLDDRRVKECLKELAEKWTQLQAEAAAKKADLLARIGPLQNPYHPLQAHLVGLQERGQKASEDAAKRGKTGLQGQAPRPQPVQSTPRLIGRTNNARATTPATPTQRVRTITGVSPIARRVAARSVAAQRQRAMTKTPEAYVADPKNDLDVALGSIVNDSPYKVRVKMVPGEVGKYWFGDTNPKLAYCRILRSRMVMVRVGGGWVELSQFLHDHALLEGGKFVPRNTDGGNGQGHIREGFLHTNRATSPGGVVTIRGGGGGRTNGTASPIMRESRSTPYHRGLSPISFAGGHHGIKNGNKFLVTDGEGNQVEVKMTKAKTKDSKFITPWRTN
ncbi:uncharacterized protein BYT42DRAFT_582060 [Radiomyces spectabilis]|uniref:uncharacterized protein n=1 Tax=Radiomyces spectabilis TaxID=64574 RepID=UPI002220C5AE|nr:uncharacterized protein BYT42DRAFT_582060 [Radiomyces spectabilis]KAI8370362.1 hypothetical protein BYT42DRAFT_582060 [Radiomyces spectabilis]